MGRAKTYGAGGFTLVEVLVFMSIWAAVSISSLWIVRESTLMRARASQRAELALVAQSELERARAVPAAELAPGAQLREPGEWWPEGTSCTVAFAPMTSATWQVTVQAARSVAHPIRPVTLATVRRAEP